MTFERFTDRARRVVVLSQEESRLRGELSICPAHILLGLIHEGEGIAAIALKALGANLGAARCFFKEDDDADHWRPDSPQEFTASAKKVVELALREALQLGHNYIGTEHLLLALVRQGDAVVFQVLDGMRIRPTSVRQMVMQVLSGYTANDAIRDALAPTTTVGKPPEYLPDREPVTVRISVFLVGDSPNEYVTVTREDDQKAWRVSGPQTRYARLVPFDDRTEDGSEAALSAAVDLVKLLREQAAVTAKTTEALTAWTEGR